QALVLDGIDPAAEDRGAFVAGVEQRQLPRLPLVAESADAVVRDGDLRVVHLLGPPRPAGRAGPSPARGSPFTRHAAPLPSPDPAGSPSRPDGGGPGRAWTGRSGAAFLPGPPARGRFPAPARSRRATSSRTPPRSGSRSASRRGRGTRGRGG